MKLAIVIVNYNTLSDTIDCLESLKKSELPHDLKLTTILVDNASRDDSVEVLSGKYPEVDLISSPHNLGFAGGNNLGIKKALTYQPDWILLLNPDTVVSKNFFTSFVYSVNKNLSAGIITPLIYFAKGFEFHQNRYQKEDLGKVVWSAGGKIDWSNLLASNAHVDEVNHGQFAQSVNTDFATGACMFIKTKVIKNIGLLNENYFLYLEDLEFCQRAKKKNWPIIFDPQIKIWHKVSQSSGIGSDLNDYFITRNRLLFGFQYAPLRTKIALLREAIRFLRSNNPARQTAVKDFLFHRLGKGTWLK